MLNISIFLLTAIVPQLPAMSANNIKFDRLSITEGLSQVTVFSIIQDDQGFLWIGTMDGLNKYDGYQFRVYRNEFDKRYSISNNHIRTLFRDRDGAIWAGTENGLNRYDRNYDRFIPYHHRQDKHKTISHNSISSIDQDNSGLLWIGTDKGLNCFDPEKNNFVSLSKFSLPKNLNLEKISILKIDTKGYMWIGTERGLLRLNRENGIIQKYGDQSENINMLSNPVITAIFEDRQGDIWVGTRDGLNKYDPVNNKFIVYRYDRQSSKKTDANRINVIHEDSHGILWIGTAHGLHQFQRNTNRFITYQHNPNDPKSLSHNDIYCIFEDRTGVLWFGTFGNGINKYDRGRQHFLTYKHSDTDPNSLSDNFVYVLFESKKDILWIATNSGLNKFNRRKNIFTVYKHDPDDPYSISSNKVRAIYEDKEGALWIGTYRGFSRFDEKNDRFIRYDIDSEKLRGRDVKNFVIMNFLEDRKGNFWIGSKENGIMVFDKHLTLIHYFLNDPANPESLSSDGIRKIYMDQSGDIWIATYGGGICKYNYETNQFTAYMHNPDDPSTISSNFVYTIYEQPKNILWIGTYGAGLNRFDKETEKFIHFTTADGLPNNLVYGILGDGRGNLWLSTNRGLSRFNADGYKGENAKSLFRNYDMRDGLQSNEFNFGAYHKNDRGEMFFGGIDGFNIFHPDSIFDNKIKPQVLITDFRIYNTRPNIGPKSTLKKHISTLDTIKLSYEQNALYFEFAAIHYSNPEKNQYAYILEGIDKDWIYTDARKRFANYTNLSGGHYKFRVKASNSDGVWNQRGARLEIIITPPFWETWLFRIFSGLLLISFVVVIYKVRTSRFKKRNQVLYDMNRDLNREIERRHRVEEALRESEEKYRTIFQSSPVGIFHFDNNGVITNCNDNFVEIIGSSKRALIGLDMPRQLKDQKMIGQIKHVLATGHGYYEDNYQSVTANKSTPVRVLLNGIFSLDKKIVGGVGIVEDITERRRHEKLQQVVYKIAEAVNSTDDTSEFYFVVQNELSKLIDTTNFFIGLYDKATDTLSLPFMKDEKDRFERLPAANTISALVIKNNKSLLLKEKDMDELERQGKIGSVGSPSKVWLGIPLRLDKEVIGILVVQNYTDENAYDESDLALLEFVSNQLAVSVKKKQAEEEIRKLSRSIEQGPAAVIITDIDGRIEYINQKLTEKSGYTIDAVKGKNLRTLQALNLEEKESGKLWQKIISGKEWHAEVQNRDKNDELYWEFISVSPIKNEQGHITHVLISKEDISELKRLQNQLNQAQKMESIGTLAGGIAHDFNNLLTVINGHAEIALMKLDQGNTLHKYLHSILQAGKRAENLTRQLLAFSRKQIVEARIVDINEIFRGMDKMLRRLIGEDISIKTILTDNLPKIKADPGQLEQVLMNIVINARDAINEKTTFSNGKNIIIETDHISKSEADFKNGFSIPGGDYVCFSISDNGGGMNDEVKAKIFDPFFTTKEVGKGTGLGMATVYGIIKQNQSFINVYSEPGQGTTFKIYWPATTEQKAEDKSDVQEHTHKGAETVLVVEDNDEVREFTVITLKELGYNVIDAGNGQDAVKFVESNDTRFDLLITDIVMPGMNGKELAEVLQEKIPHLKVLYTSGYTNNHIVHNGTLEENIDFLQKPFSVPGLAQKIRAVLDQ